MKDICCIGHITLDKIITPDTEVFMNGGTAFYFAYAMNHLPKKVSFQLVTAMGEKDIKAVRDMREQGIDVVCHQSRNTVFFENKYGRNMNNRQQRVLAKADPFTVSQVEHLQAKVFHLGSLLADDFSPEVVKCLAAKGRVSIDVQGFLREVRQQHVYATDWKDKLEVLHYTDILKLNEYEMEAITGHRDPHDVARQIAQWGVREVVITLGDYGSVIYHDGQFDEVPAYKPRRTVDTTGCGDTYSTGYLYCRAQGMSCAESGRFAAAMCTLKLEHSGPFDRSIDDIEKLIASV
jgi:sugar/nucleoside kinase (ribokinase family)